MFAHKERIKTMNPIFDRISLLAIKVERFVSLATLFSVALFLTRIANPDGNGGTGR
jgi:hypothetical protein